MKICIILTISVYNMSDDKAVEATMRLVYYGYYYKTS